MLCYSELWELHAANTTRRAACYFSADQAAVAIPLYVHIPII